MTYALLDRATGAVLLTGSLAACRYWARVFVAAGVAGNLAVRHDRAEARRVATEYESLCRRAEELAASPRTDVDIVADRRDALRLLDEAVAMAPDRPEAYLWRALAAQAGARRRASRTSTGRSQEGFRRGRGTWRARTSFEARGGGRRPSGRRRRRGRSRPRDRWIGTARGASTWRGDGGRRPRRA